jgi:rare lipoprotein A
MSSCSRSAASSSGIDGVSILYVALSLPHLAQLFALALTAAVLAACTQVPAISSRSEMYAARQQTSFVTTKKRNQVAFGRRMGAPRFARAPGDAKAGLASFYTEGSRTASGERLNPTELTAAHPSLPFGTRVRVTSVDTGRSVIVRVNDRGPFVKGRVLDVSYSAAKQLDMTKRGVAKVKIDVLQ